MLCQLIFPTFSKKWFIALKTFVLFRKSRKKYVLTTNNIRIQFIVCWQIES